MQEEMDYSCKGQSAIARSKRKEGSSAPNQEEIEQYLRYIQDYKIEGKALVLGATPELRDMLINQGFEVHAVDKSNELFPLMDKCMINKNVDEKYVADWLNMLNLFEEESFDLVITDAGMNNISHDVVDKFLEVVKILMKKGSFFIMRNMVTKKLPKMTYDKVINSFHNGINTKMGIFIELGYRTKLFDKAYKGYYMRWGEIAKEMLEVTRADETIFPFIKNILIYAKHVDSLVYPFEYFEKKLAEHFQLLSVDMVKWRYSTLLPFFCLRKK